jgi:hypothetical protein
LKSKRMVAVCDILGFSNLVETSDLDTVVIKAVEWFRKALHHSLHKKNFPQEIPVFKELESHEHIGVAWFSDTIFFYTKGDTDDSIRELLATVAWLLFETHMQGVTRVRVGIAYGDVFIDPDNSLYVGQPIIEAHQLEQQQQWSGGALAESAYERIPLVARSGQYADWWIVPYEVPLKEKGPTNMLAVNWNQGIHNKKWRFRWSSNSPMPGDLDWAEDFSRCEKFVNTKKFHELHCLDCGQITTC